MDAADADVEVVFVAVLEGEHVLFFAALCACGNIDASAGQRTRP